MWVANFSQCNTVTYKFPYEIHLLPNSQRGLGLRASARIRKKILDHSSREVANKKAKKTTEMVEA
jgi:hypothetical protein